MVAPTSVVGPSKAPAPTVLREGVRWLQGNIQKRNGRAVPFYYASMGAVSSHKGHYTEIFATRMTIFSE